jgi:hypothetical protein
MADNDLNPSDKKTATQSLRDEKEKSLDLKRRIDEAKRRHDMPLDSNLGDPNWEERAADGHLDLPDNAED